MNNKIIYFLIAVAYNLCFYATAMEESSKSSLGKRTLDDCSLTTQEKKTTVKRPRRDYEEAHELYDLASEIEAALTSEPDEVSDLIDFAAEIESALTSKAQEIDKTTKLYKLEEMLKDGSWPAFQCIAERLYTGNIPHNAVDGLAPIFASTFNLNPYKLTDKELYASIVMLCSPAVINTFFIENNGELSQLLQVQQAIINRIVSRAEKGKHIAQATLGMLYAQVINAQQIIGDQDHREALRWSKAAASKGDIMGQYLMARYTYCFASTQEEVDTAFNIMRKLADLDYIEAQNWLGNVYLNGSPFHKASSINSENWFRRVSEKGGFCLPLSPFKRLMDVSQELLQHIINLGAESIVSQEEAKAYYAINNTCQQFRQAFQPILSKHPYWQTRSITNNIYKNLPESLQAYKFAKAFALLQLPRTHSNLEPNDIFGELVSQEYPPAINLSTILGLSIAPKEGTWLGENFHTAITPICLDKNNVHNFSFKFSNMRNLDTKSFIYHYVDLFCQTHTGNIAEIYIKKNFSKLYGPSRRSSSSPSKDIILEFMALYFSKTPVANNRPLYLQLKRWGNEPFTEVEFLNDTINPLIVKALEPGSNKFEEALYGINFYVTFLNCRALNSQIEIPVLGFVNNYIELLKRRLEENYPCHLITPNANKRYDENDLVNHVIIRVLFNNLATLYQKLEDRGNLDTQELRQAFLSHVDFGNERLGL